MKFTIPYNGVEGGFTNRCLSSVYPVLHFSSAGIALASPKSHSDVRVSNFTAASYLHVHVLRCIEPPLGLSPRDLLHMFPPEVDQLRRESYGASQGDELLQLSRLRIHAGCARTSSCPSPPHSQLSRHLARLAHETIL